MSRILGESADRIPLSSAHGAMAASVRRAAAPSPVWLAGLCYPVLGLLLSFGWFALFRERGDGAGAHLGSIFAPLAFPPCFRVMAGLARVHGREDVARPTLRGVWEGGRGLTFASMGLWLQIVALEVLVVAAALALARWQGEQGWGLTLLASPLLGMLLVYALTLTVLYQLALHSLAHNRRGTGSALQHAWRLLRHDPWGALRATLVDLELNVMSLVFTRVLAIATIPLLVLQPLVATLLFAAVQGLLGVARAGYWAVVYRELGGLAPEDGVPGSTLR